MEKITKVLVFVINEQEYGVNIDQVESIERFEDVTEASQKSGFIKGTISLRNETIPIIDLKERLYFEETVSTNETKIVIVILGTMQIGLIVDIATDVIDIDPTSIERAPKIIESIETKYLTGVTRLTNGLLLILNIKALLSHEEIEGIQGMVKKE